MHKVVKLRRQRQTPLPLPEKTSQAAATTNEASKSPRGTISSHDQHQEMLKSAGVIIYNIEKTVVSTYMSKLKK